LIVEDLRRRELGRVDEPLKLAHVAEGPVMSGATQNSFPGELELFVVAFVAGVLAPEMWPCRRPASHSPETPGHEPEFWKRMAPCLGELDAFERARVFGGPAGRLQDDRGRFQKAASWRFCDRRRLEKKKLH